MNHLEKKSWIISFLLWWWAEEIRLLARKNGRFVKTAFYFSTRTFWGKEIDMFYFFLELEQTFLPVPAKNLGQVCRNCIVGGQRSLLHKTSVSGKANSLSCFWFRIFSVRSLVYLQKNIGILSPVKSDFHPFIAIIWGQKTENFFCAFFLIFGRNNSKF